MLMVPGEYHIAGTSYWQPFFNNCCTTKRAFLETLFANNLLGLGSNPQKFTIPAIMVARVSGRGIAIGCLDLVCFGTHHIFPPAILLNTYLTIYAKIFQHLRQSLRINECT